MCKGVVGPNRKSTYISTGELLDLKGKFVSAMFGESMEDRCKQRKKHAKDTNIRKYDAL